MNLCVVRWESGPAKVPRSTLANVAEFLLKLLLWAAVSSVVLTNGNEDVILSPVHDDATLPKCLLVFIDGGGARSGKLVYYHSRSKAFGAVYGQETVLQTIPVHVLPGMDHSDFCPGFFVTAIEDIHSEVTQVVAMSTIGQGVSAFLCLNLPTDDTLQSDAKATTSSLLEPGLTVLVMEQGSWFVLSQKQIGGLSSEDAGLLQVEVDAVSVSVFSTTTTYTSGSSGLNVTISTSEPTYGAGPTEPSVLGWIHQLDRDLGLSAGDVPCSEHLALDLAQATKLVVWEFLAEQD